MSDLRDRRGCCISCGAPVETTRYEPKIGMDFMNGKKNHFRGNVALGYQAGYAISTGNENILIGYKELSG